MDTILKEITENIFNELGPGFSEHIYQQAMSVEFNERGIKYSIEPQILIYYKDVNIGFNRGDFIISFNDKKYIIELKALIGNPSEIDKLQLKNYLKWTKISTGFLINFPQISRKGSITDIFIEKIKLNNK